MLVVLAIRCLMGGGGVRWGGSYLYSVARVNWNASGRKRCWPNRGTIPGLFYRD
jgi:hypothetical protein